MSMGADTHPKEILVLLRSKPTVLVFPHWRLWRLFDNLTIDTSAPSRNSPLEYLLRQLSVVDMVTPQVDRECNLPTLGQREVVIQIIQTAVAQSLGWAHFRTRQQVQVPLSCRNPRCMWLAGRKWVLNVGELSVQSLVQHFVCTPWKCPVCHLQTPSNYWEVVPGPLHNYNNPYARRAFMVMSNTDIKSKSFRKHLPQSIEILIPDVSSVRLKQICIQIQK